MQKLAKEQKPSLPPCKWLWFHTIDKIVWHVLASSTKIGKNCEIDKNCLARFGINFQVYISIYLERVKTIPYIT